MAAETEKDSIYEDMLCHLKSQFEQKHRDYYTKPRYLKAYYKNACMKSEKDLKDLNDGLAEYTVTCTIS